MSALSDWFQGIDLDRILEWLMFAAAAVIALPVHESCHALSAHWLGDDTAKRMGRISLNPLRHFDPAGFIFLVVAHFGWARPVPINPDAMTKLKRPHQVGMALTAAAGPLSNVLLALIFTFAFNLVYYAGGLPLWLMWADYAEPSGWQYWLMYFFYICMLLNAGLAVFNLIPISPLDGSKILAIFLPDRAHAWLMRYERYGMLLLALLLVTGLLDTPLIFLRNGLLDGLDALAAPLARMIAGV